MEKYKCPKCDAEFLLGTKFCEGCGCNLEVEFIENPICPKCRKTFPTGTVFCSEDGTKLVSPEQMIPKCIKCGKVYNDGTKFCIQDGGKVIPEALRTPLDFDKGKELIVENLDKGKKLIDSLSKNQKIGIIGGCFAIIVLMIALTGGSPGKKAAKAYCDCVEIDLKQSEYEYFNKREVERCFERKIEKYWKHIEKVRYGVPIFKNPKHQREYEETLKECMFKLGNPGNDLAIPEHIQPDIQLY